MNNLLRAIKGEFDFDALKYNTNADRIKSNLNFVRSILHLDNNDYAIRMLRTMLSHHYISMKFSNIDSDAELRGVLPEKTQEFEYSVKDTIEAYKNTPELFDLMQEAGTIDLFYLSDSTEEQYAIIGYTITKLVNYA